MRIATSFPVQSSAHRRPSPNGRATSSRGGRSSCIACTGTRSRRTRPRRCARRDSMRAISRAASKAGGNTAAATAPYAPPTRWVTRARPKIDRIACPWLIRRFIDPSAEFFYVPNRGSARLRREEWRHGLRRPGRHLHARRPGMQFRCVHPHPRLAHPALDRARDDRPRRRHVRAASRRAGTRAAVGVARAVGDVRRRPHDAEVGHARLRLAVRLVPRGAGRDARLVSGEVAIQESA